ncbi:MAG: hypothetical protein KKC51_08180 [Verrucomicrobia bacterium]|nr:hypothetical protein [Verrucomicrobiota bacterium]
MCAVARKMPFERRLKELEREARQVRADLKVLNKALQKPERLAAVSRPKSLKKIEEAVAPPNRGDPVVRSREPGAGAPPVPTGELFAWRSPVPVREKGRTAPGRAAEPTPKAGHLLQDDRFANYFSSGSFVRTRPAAGGSRVQRNKALFMLVLVIIFGFILFSFLF